jgi:hypothetical protein
VSSTVDVSGRGVSPVVDGVLELPALPATVAPPLEAESPPPAELAAPPDVIVPVVAPEPSVAAVVDPAFTELVPLLVVVPTTVTLVTEELATLGLVRSSFGSS